MKRQHCHKVTDSAAVQQSADVCDWWHQVGAKLTHSIDTINSFGELKVVVPLNASQIPATLETLKARKQHYLEERAKVGNLAALMNMHAQLPCAWCCSGLQQRQTLHHETLGLLAWGFDRGSLMRAGLPGEPCF